MSAQPDTPPTPSTIPSDSGLTAVYFSLIPEENTEPTSGDTGPTGEAAEPVSTAPPAAASEPDQTVPARLAAHVEALVDRLVQERMNALTASQTPDPLWDVDEVAAYLGVSRRTVDTLIASGEIKPMRVGRQRRFHRKSIDAYLRSTVS